MKYYTIDGLSFMYIIKARTLRSARSMAHGRHGRTGVKDIHEATKDELEWYLSMSGVSSLNDVEVIGEGV